MQTAFSEKFFDRVEDRFYDLGKRQDKVIGLQLPVLLVLAVSLLPLKLKFSFLGLSIADTKGLREILIVISTGLGTYASMLGRRAVYLKEILQARAEKLDDENQGAKNTLEVAYGISYGWEPDPDETDLKPSWAKSAIRFVMLLIQVVFGLVIIVGILAIHLLILIDIYKNPSVSELASLLTIAFVLMIDLIIFSNFYLTRGLFPYKNQSWQKLFKQWERNNPELYRTTMEAAQNGYSAQGLFGRLLIAPKPIKVFRKAPRRIERKQKWEARGLKAARWFRRRTKG